MTHLFEPTFERTSPARDYLILNAMDEEAVAIIQGVCARSNITTTLLLGNCRARRLAWPRQEAYWRCYYEAGMSLMEIGRLFKRDHTTVLYGMRAHQKRVGL